MRIYKIMYVLLTCLFVSGCATGGYSGYTGDDAYRKARKCYDRKQYEKAIEHYEQYLAGKPNTYSDDVALYYLGDSYMKTKDYDRAKATYQKLIDKKDADVFWVDYAKKDLKEMKELETK